jgi:hypothetical protein
MTIQAAKPLKDVNVFKTISHSIEIHNNHHSFTAHMHQLFFRCLARINNVMIKGQCAKLLTLMPVITELVGCSSQVLMI